jgi:uncharacterized membrane protein YdbT with pleckstrin-like domain
MGYVDSVLRPGEHVVARGELHWIIYASAVGWLLAAIVCLLLSQRYPAYAWYFNVAAGAFAIVSALFAVRAWFDQWITEIAVTNLRVIFKTGFIRRHTAEMNMDKVESVVVNQSILGRLLDYGTIHVMGTGEGIERLHKVKSPIALRNCITAR